MNIIEFILYFIAAYIAGSINFSIVLFKILKKGDPREKFSGNAGVTNVYRQAGLFWAVAVLLLDVGRACAVGFIAMTFLPAGYISFLCFGLLLGNRFPVFHGFRGGKGVANFLGYSAVINPMAASIAVQIWVLVYVLARTPFIASIFMVIFLGYGIVSATGLNPFEIAGASLCVIFIFINHLKNIREKTVKG